MWRQQGQRPDRLQPLREVWPVVEAGQQNAPFAGGAGVEACSASAARVVAGGLKAVWG